MKNYGKLIEYNGIYGTIFGIDGIKYTVLDKDVIDKNIKKDDNVIFDSENIIKNDIEVNLARFVRKLDIK